MMNKPATNFPWLHMVVIAIVYAIAIFAACALVNLVNGWTLYVAYVVLVPALLVFGMWAALGQGNLGLRVIVFTLLGSLLFIAAVAGLFVDPINRGLLIDSETSSVSEFALAFMATFGVCVACQVPFWFLRIVFGWQLIQAERNWSETKISIRDFFS